MICSRRSSPTNTHEGRREKGAENASRIQKRNFDLDEWKKTMNPSMHVRPLFRESITPNEQNLPGLFGRKNWSAEEAVPEI